MKWAPHIALLLLAQAVSAPAASATHDAATASQTSLIRLIVGELARTQGMQFAGEVALWSALGGLAGILLAVAGYFAFRSLGWYQSQWKYAKWARRGLAMLSLLACAVFLGLGGLWHGVTRGCERVLTQSRLATDVFPLVGNAVADGAVLLDEAITHGKEWVSNDTNLTAHSEELGAAVRTFRSDEREWNVPAFLRRLDRFAQDSLGELTEKVVHATLNEYPKLKTVMGELVLRRMLTALVQHLSLDQLDPVLHQAGGIVVLSRERLLAEAARAGNPETISHRELSAFVVNGGIVPAIMGPIRAMALAHQVVVIPLSVPAVVLPALLFRLTNRRVKTSPPTPAGNPVPPPIRQ